MSIYITAIEIGSSKVKGAVGIVGDDHSIRIVAIEECPLSPGSVRYGSVVNVEDVSQSINRIKTLLENNPNVSPRKITGAYVALGGRSLSSHLTEASKTFSTETEITESIVGELKAQARHTPSALKEVLDIVPLLYNIDGKSIRIPVGTLGYQIRARYNLVACDEKNNRNIKRAFEKSGLNYMGGITRILAIDSLILAKDQRNLGCAIIDFGAETTTVAVYKDNALRFLNTIPMGSRLITRDLAKLLNISEERAEELKINHVNLLRNSEDDKLERTLDGLDYKLINNIAQARASEIVSNISNQINQAGLKPEDLTEGVIVVGKGSRLNGFRELVHNMLNVKIARPGVPNIEIMGKPSVPVEESTDVLAVMIAAARSGRAAECTEIPVAAEPEVVIDPPKKTGKNGNEKKGDNDKGGKKKNIFGGIFNLLTGDEADFDDDEKYEDNN